MATYVPPKDVIDGLLDALRALSTGVLACPAKGGTCVYRKGPQRSVALAGTETAVVFVALAEMSSGEQSAGSANNWTHEWDVKLLCCVPDDETDPEGSEDARLDLIDAVLDFVHDNRTLAGAARVVRVGNVKCLIGELFANDPQVFRMADITLTYRTAKS